MTGSYSTVTNYVEYGSGVAELVILVAVGSGCCAAEWVLVVCGVTASVIRNCAEAHADVDVFILAAVV